MELDKFIAESLVSIHEALKKANNELTKEYPNEKKKNTFLLKPGSKKSDGSGVHFDLAITLNKTEETKGKVRAKIFVLSSEISEKNTKNNESVSRISFTVDVSRYTGQYKKLPLK